MFLYKFEARQRLSSIVEYELTHDREFNQEDFNNIVNSAIEKFNDNLTEEELSDIGPCDHIFGIYQILIDEYGFKKPIFTQEILLTNDPDMQNPFHKGLPE